MGKITYPGVSETRSLVRKTKETWINDLSSKKIVFRIVSPFKGCLTKAERKCSRCGNTHVTTFNILLDSGPLCRSCKYAVTTRTAVNAKPIGPYGSISEAARALGVKENMLRMRISMGWSVEEVLEKITRGRKLQALPLYSQAEIYLIRSTRTKKVYVGLTGSNSFRRFEQHLSDARHGSNSPIHKAMRSLGYGSFKVHRLKRCSLREAPRWERFYIKKLQGYCRCF